MSVTADGRTTDSDVVGPHLLPFSPGGRFEYLICNSHGGKLLRLGPVFAIVHESHTVMFCGGHYGAAEEILGAPLTRWQASGDTLRLSNWRGAVTFERYERKGPAYSYERPAYDFDAYRARAGMWASWAVRATPTAEPVYRSVRVPLAASRTVAVTATRGHRPGLLLVGGFAPRGSRVVYQEPGGAPVDLYADGMGAWGCFHGSVATQGRGGTLTAYTKGGTVVATAAVPAAGTGSGVEPRRTEPPAERYVSAGRTGRGS